MLTRENRDEVLPRFFHLSKSDAKEVAVEIRPLAAPLRDVVTTVRPVAPALTLPQPAPTDPGHPVHPANQVLAAVTRPVAAAPASRGDSVEPLNAEASRVHVTVSRRFLKKLEAARDALSHSHPDAGFEEILEAGLDLLLDRDAKRKGLVKKPRPVPPPSSDPEHVPADVRRTVWKRDGGRCQWKLASGAICGSTRKVELDHQVARARAGPPTVANLRCLCRAHNDLAAREVFGDAWMDQFTRNPRAGASGCDAPPPPAA